MELQGKKVLAFVDEEFEDLEMWYPVLRPLHWNLCVF